MNAKPSAVVPIKSDLPTREFLTHHLKFFPKETWLHIAALHPIDRKLNRHKCYRPDDIEGMLAWVAKYQATHNLYLTMNPVKNRRNAKPRKGHIACVICAVADVDPGRAETEADDIREIEAALNSFDPKPSVILNSGRGRWGIWYFAKPIWLDFGDIDPMNKAEKDKIAAICAPAESYSKALKEFFPNGDAVQNVDRLGRLIGTTWHPTPKKIESGWTESRPIPGAIRLTDTRHTPEAIVANLLKATNAATVSEIKPAKQHYFLKDAPIPKEEKEDIKDGITARRFSDGGKIDWSRWSLSKIRYLLVAGLEADEIMALSLHPDNALSNHFNREDDPERAVRRAIEKALSDNQSLFDKLNDKFSAVMVGGKFRIAEIREDHMDSEELMLNEDASLRKFYSNQPIGLKLNPIDFWLKHPARTSYDEVVFEPGKETPGKLNLYRGFRTKPKKTGSWSLFRDHLVNNTAAGIDERFQYLFGWFAHIRQYPANLIGTSLAIRGGQGTGKSIIFEIFGHTLRPYYLSVSDKEEVIGRFNAHLSNKLLVFADEAIFAADPRVSGLLKYAITQPRRKLEKKFNDAVYVRNFIRLGIASNHDWVVPAELDDRRFAVFDVLDNGQRNDRRNYFQPMFDQLDDGGYQKLTQDLLDFDLDSIDLRKIPETFARGEQRLKSAPGHVRFWYEFLNAGELVQVCTKWPEWVVITDLHEAYVRFMRTQKTGDILPDSQFGKQIKRMSPDVVKRSRSSDERGYLNCYVLPKLDVAREAFAKFIKLDSAELFDPEVTQDDSL